VHCEQGRSIQIGCVSLCFSPVFVVVVIAIPFQRIKIRYSLHSTVPVCTVIFSALGPPIVALLVSLCHLTKPITSQDSEKQRDTEGLHGASGMRCWCVSLLDLSPISLEDDVRLSLGPSCVHPLSSLPSSLSTRKASAPVYCCSSLVVWAFSSEGT